MQKQQCNVQVFQCKRSPFPKSSKTSSYDWARGQLSLREIKFYKELQQDYKRKDLQDLQFELDTIKRKKQLSRDLRMAKDTSKIQLYTMDKKRNKH
jgi:hypothetical protein